MSPDARPPVGRHSRSGFQSVLRALLGVIVALLAAEVVARQVLSIHWRDLPSLGFVQTEVLYRVEGNGRSRWWGEGLRRPAPPSPNEPSIAVLGDSFTEALMVSDEDLYTHRLERRLRAQGRGVQVLNFGVSGASPADYVLYANDVRQRFSNRWTIIQLTPADLDGDAFRKELNHFVREADGSLRPVEVRRTLFASTRESRLMTLHRRYFPSMLLHLAWFRVQALASGARAEAPLFRAPHPVRPASKSAKGYPEADVRRQLDLMQQAFGGRVTFLFIPRYDPDDPDRPQGSTETTFDRWCSEPGHSCVNLRRSYGAIARRHEVPFGFANTKFNTGHLNPVGHAAAAAALDQEVGRLISHDLF